ncbi:BA14K family protein [Brucella sp. IR073]|uniref:BA14K family protein n=1 Tax=unclassified Brucella TaxID=2632610 RepID=UPI003B9877DA
MTLPETLRTVLLAAACLTLALSAASAIEIRQESGLRPLRPVTPQVMNGMSGNPGAPRDKRIIVPNIRSGSNSPSVNHIQWCQNRYNSYRSSDNSYQPFAGTRRECSSPFGGE